MSDQPPPPVLPRILVSRNGQQFGPYTPPEVWSYLQSGHILPTDMAATENSTVWQPLNQLMGIANLPPMPGAAPSLGQDAGMRMILPVGRSGWAIAAGYLGLFGLIVLPAPLALITALIAIWDIRRHRHDPQPRHGMGRAIFGLIVGVLGTGLLLVLLVARFMRS